MSLPAFRLVILNAYDFSVSSKVNPARRVYAASASRMSSSTGNPAPASAAASLRPLSGRNAKGELLLKLLISVDVVLPLLVGKEKEKECF